jgi:hypothetical protein
MAECREMPVEDLAAVIEENWRRFLEMK